MCPASCAETVEQGREIAWMPTGSPTGSYPILPSQGAAAVQGHVFVSDYIWAWVVKLPPAEGAPLTVSGPSAAFRTPAR